LQPHRKRVDNDIEKIVGRLSLEPTVSAARWQADVRIEMETYAAHADIGDTPTGAVKSTG
jgi:hypothetical protein